MNPNLQNILEEVEREVKKEKRKNNFNEIVSSKKKIKINKEKIAEIQQDLKKIKEKQGKNNNPLKEVAATKQRSLLKATPLATIEKESTFDFLMETVSTKDFEKTEKEIQNLVEQFDKLKTLLAKRP